MEYLEKVGVAITRNTVMEIARELDPEGVSTRKKKRLSMTHRSYDKLKPYGCKGALTQNNLDASFSKQKRFKHMIKNTAHNPSLQSHVEMGIFFLFK